MDDNRPNHECSIAHCMMIQKIIRPRLKLLIYLLPVLMAVSCAAPRQSAKKPPLRLYSTTLCKSVDQYDKTGVPLNPAQQFDSRDKQIVAFVRMDNLSGRHRLSWDWYAPNGRLHRRSESTPIQISKGKYCRTVTTWHALDVQHDGVSLLPGQWAVAFKVNGKTVDRKSFTFQHR